MTQVFLLDQSYIFHADSSKNNLNFLHNTNGITGLSQLKPDIRILFDTAYFQCA